MLFVPSTEGVDEHSLSWAHPLHPLQVSSQSGFPFPLHPLPCNYQIRNILVRYRHNTLARCPSPSTLSQLYSPPLFGPRWPPKNFVRRPPDSQMCTSPLWPDLTHTSLAPSVPLGHECPVKFCTPPSRLTNIYVAPLARLNTSQTPIPRCLNQVRYIDISC